MALPNTRTKLTSAFHCKDDELESSMVIAYEKLISWYDFKDTAAGQRDRRLAAKLIADIILQKVEYGDASIDFENEVPGLGRKVFVTSLFEWCVGGMRFSRLECPFTIGSEEWHVGIASLLAECRLSYEKEEFFRLYRIEELCRLACPSDAAMYASAVPLVLAACCAVLGDQLPTFE